jgi:hypothetical protein
MLRIMFKPLDLPETKGDAGSGAVNRDEHAAGGGRAVSPAVRPTED